MAKRHPRRRTNGAEPIKTTGTRRLATIAQTISYAPGLKRWAIYKLLNDGAIKAYKLNGRTLVDLTSVDAYLSKLPEYRAC